MTVMEGAAQTGSTTRRNYRGALVQHHHSESLTTSVFAVTDSLFMCLTIVLQ
jgi:hypothetical protein